MGRDGMNEDATLTLGLAYLTHGHDEHGVEVLKDCLLKAEESLPLLMIYPLYLQALLRLGRMEEFLRAFEKQRGWLEDIPVFAIMAANAFLKGRDRKAALSLLRRMEKELPVPPVDTLQRDDGPLPDEYPVENALPLLISLGLTPYLYFEYILPLLSGARKMTCSFLDELLYGLPQEGELEDRLKKVASSLISLFGLRLFFFNGCQEFEGALHPMVKVFYYRESAYDVILKAMQESFCAGLPLNGSERSQWQEELFLQEGKLLDYPACCVRHAAFRRFVEGKSGNEEEEKCMD